MFAYFVSVIKMCHISSQIESSENDAEKLSRLHEALADTYCNMACYYPAVKHYKIQVGITVFNDVPFL